MNPIFKDKTSAGVNHVLCTYNGAEGWNSNWNGTTSADEISIGRLRPTFQSRKVYLRLVGERYPLDCIVQSAETQTPEEPGS